MRRSEALAELEVGEYATPAEIKTAYRDLVKVWHPDRFGSDARLRQRAEERLQRINEAYRRLESADFGPEAVTQVEPVAGEAPIRARMKTRAERDAALRGWVYLAIVVMIGAFAGYAVVEHVRAAREASEIGAPAAAAVAQSAPSTAAGRAGAAGGSEAAMRASRTPVVRVTHLSEAQIEKMEAACGGFAPESQLHSECARAQVAQMTGAAGPHSGRPDLSRLTAAERASVEHVCARAASYGQCAAEQMASLAAEPERPDLSQLSARDRSAVERACSSARDHDGPAAYDRCAAEFERMLLPTHVR